jgi:uncharacterized membrane protein YoaK (UPF0700 family)
MPIAFARRLTGNARSPASDRHLGYALAFIAGGINAGGFVAVHQYTSHMTGVASALSNGIASGGWALVGASVASLLSFATGAATCTVLVQAARRRRMQSEYALPLLLEAALLLAFGLTGGRYGAAGALLLSATVMLLCFIMGLQNALVTKLSKAEIRTTHVTGIVTDIGIELGRRLFARAAPTQPSSTPGPAVSRLALFARLLGAFIAGGVAGTAAFRAIGDLATIPLASMLIACALVPVVDDARAWRNSRRAPR